MSGKSSGCVVQIVPQRPASKWCEPSSSTRKGSVVADERGGGDSTYVGQLRAFAAGIARGEQVTTSAPHAVTTMRLIDDAYRAAGLDLR